PPLEPQPEQFAPAHVSQQNEMSRPRHGVARITMSTATSGDSAFQAGFAHIAQALADPAREAMVAALGDGQALPAGELAAAAGVSAQGASAHLHKLVTAGILSVWAQGRFRYYRIANEEVAALVENLVNLASRPAPRSARHRVAP